MTRLQQGDRTPGGFSCTQSPWQEQQWLTSWITGGEILPGVAIQHHRFEWMRLPEIHELLHQVGWNFTVVVFHQVSPAFRVMFYLPLGGKTAIAHYKPHRILRKPKVNGYVPPGWSLIPPCAPRYTSH